MMKSCDKCLENNWSFKHIDGWIIATCEFCGNEVQFMSKKEKRNNKKVIKN